MADPQGPLAAGFAPRGRSDYEELLREDLRGTEPARLESRTADDVSIHPLFLDGEFLSVARPDPAPAVLGIVGAEANGRIAASVDDALARGATGVMLRLSGPGLRNGLDAEPADWGPVLDAAVSGPLHLRARADGLAHARAWLEAEGLAGRSGCSLGLDPFADVARTGALADLPRALAAAARLGAEAIAHAAAPRAFVLDADFASAAGATTAQSVGTLLAGLVETLRALEAASVDPARGSTTIELCLRLDTRFFEQIAALRALRLLHRRIGLACGVEDPPPLYLSALPAERALSRRDPWVNLLRQTATSFAGLTGGADAVGAFPYDCLLEHSSATARRIARNTPLILAEESGLGRVEDPAAGSWFLDEFTRQVAGRAWEFFRAIEERGGLVSVMQSGWLRAEFERSHETRRRRLARRELPRTGVSEFARLDEELPAPVTPLPAAAADAWPRHADDDEFERLRAEADRRAREDLRPRVFLASFGVPARYTARETWLAQFAAAAGIETIAADPEGDPARAFASSGAPVAILCSDDATLAERGPQIAAALVEHGRVWAAGRPSDALTAAGVERYVHAGVDVVEALTELLAAGEETP